MPTLPSEKTICGVGRKTFLFLVALAVIVVTAAVAGSVGGSIAVQNSRLAADLMSHNTVAKKEQISVVGANNDT